MSEKNNNKISKKFHRFHYLSTKKRCVTQHTRRDDGLLARAVNTFRSVLAATDHDEGGKEMPRLFRKSSSGNVPWRGLHDNGDDRIILPETHGR